MATLLSRPSATDERRPVVAMLEPGGYTEGTGTLLDEAIWDAGGIGLGRVLGLRGYAPLSIERLVTARIDLLLGAEAAQGAPSLGAEFLRHPAIAARFRQTPRLNVPSRLTDCAAPDSAKLVPLLRAALARLPAARLAAAPAGPAP
jgi:iron complex transport system substrate-binding protein